MKKFVVEGTAARFGEGAVLGLSKAQFAARAHNVEKLRIDGAVTVVRAKRPLEFKIGEELYLEGDEPKGLTDPMSGKSVSKGERKAKAAAAPKSKKAAIVSAGKALKTAEADAAAAEKALQDAAPEAKSAAQEALDKAKAAVTDAAAALEAAKG